MQMKLKKGEKILFIGDSITDCGRRDVAAPLGSGYVRFFSDMLIMREPEKRVTIINKGIGGDVAPGLLARWADDVLWHRPDWLSIKIGINDLHRFLGNNKQKEFSYRGYEKAYTAILEQTKTKLPRCRILLIDPFYISRESSHDSHRKAVLDILPAYIRVVHKLSRKYNTRLVKTHEMFQRLLKYHDADTFCPEPVHPKPAGHLAIADAVYHALSG